MRTKRFYSQCQLLGMGVVSLLSVAVQQAHAACAFTPGPGDDAFVCDSGTSATGLTDLQGNNTLTFPAGGTGTLNGNVVTGPGADAINMESGTLVGSVTQGDGADRFRISAGTVTGAVSQGNGIDDFVMTGGQIGSLAQGDSRDTFLMTDGVIVGAFEDGDVARQTGGTIGRVDMKLDKNIYDMSGGTIRGNLVTGFDIDTITVSGGTIGGNISTSGGDDHITVSGGVIDGEIRASVGNDTFTWREGGQINSAVLMGDGNDTALLSGLSERLLAATPSVDGGLGNDRLTFDNTVSGGPARYRGWETVNLDNGSHFDLAGHFVLGDSASNTGTFSIDDSSVLAVTQGDIRPFTAGREATLVNAGIIDMTTGSASATDVLTVHGNYVGSNGLLRLQTQLGDDSSASDKLAVSGGAITGRTQLVVSNLGGHGGFTRDNGIEVVQALNGAVSNANAFALRGPVSAGAYQYYLFKGGVTAGSENNWYLRSSVVAVPPATEPSDPSSPAPDPAEVSPQPSDTTPPLPTPVPGAEPIPLYRQEVPVYSVVVPAAQVMTLQALGTFHDRQGEQSLLGKNGLGGWGRAYGSDFDKRWSGTVSPSFDGSIKGYQVGHDLFAAKTNAGYVQRAGVFIGQSRLDGDVKGFSEGFQDHRSGRVKLDGDNYGAYWTLTDPKIGWYVDLVAMGTRLDGDNKSDRGVKMDNRGHALALSAEAGYPIAVSEHWVVEPQVQVINQQIDMDSQHDGISKVSYDAQDYWTGRLGTRLKGRYVVQGTPIEPYVRVNAWKTFGGHDTVTYDDVDRIKSDHKSTSADLGVGVVATLSSTVGVYLAADYSTNLDTNDLEGVSANAGIRISW
ncbi:MULTISPECIES: autotransporter family protein [Pseudomonas putida group]|uniref:autotransporter family protein n=1 Tax=Pseudomonas putida group TaxID=136845 RepID=UPI0008636CDF|nr:MULTISPECIES: autotransporter outer membrane beta-barrel domain-containing protein [Pseudomonas putida group]